ncbi:MAG: hypothetical protein IM606_12155 [Cytophagales bacterium]|nr:hypothetical protein [Cytophagales bacterium]MCA6387078.1 hypothetical protein [Cytophagales bacterium]MCA6389804.1 hypothetical protein [Cytophagales bacterium]MCA6395931.1 hypothetical protein [Cytophagales bacterium]MCA6400603.1 hypothetical protein [Cytophagales bacterium]
MKKMQRAFGNIHSFSFVPIPILISSPTGRMKVANRHACVFGFAKGLRPQPTRVCSTCRGDRGRRQPGPQTDFCKPAGLFYSEFSRWRGAQA